MVTPKSGRAEVTGSARSLHKIHAGSMHRNGPVVSDAVQGAYPFA
jgi:hypothetical protein